MDDGERYQRFCWQQICWQQNCWQLLTNADEVKMLHNTLRTKVGPWVSGKDFFNRDTEVQRMMDWLSTGHHISLAAQRRTGKTSLLREVQRRMGGETEVIFVDVEECMTAADAIAAIAFETRAHASVWTHVKSGLGAAFGAVESVGIDKVKLTLRSEIAGAWRQKGDRLVADLTKCERPVVVMLDELPMLLARLLESEPSEAEALLSWLRKACMADNTNTCWVLTGSIGLAPIAARAGLSNLLNHYRVFDLQPWDPKTVSACLTALAAHAGLTWPEDAQECAIAALGVGIPYHVQLLFAHVEEDVRRRGASTVRPDDVTRIYAEKLLGLSALAELSHMEERLQQALPHDHHSLALELLTEAAMCAPLSVSTAVTLAGKLGFGEGHAANSALRDVFDVLQHDGYLQRTGSDWTFRSNLLRDWWKRRFGSFHTPLKEQ